MVSDSSTDGADAPDPEVLREWLGDALGRPVSQVVVEQLAGGHANGAWRLDVTMGDGCVGWCSRRRGRRASCTGCDPCREARVVGGLGRSGAPVPAVLAIDPARAPWGARAS